MTALAPAPHTPAWRVSRVLLTCVGGDREMNATVSPAAPGLAIHVDAWKVRWDVTHLPSGLRVLRALPSLASAQMITVELAQAVNWTRPADELRADPAVYAAVQRFAYLQEGD